MGAKFWQTYSPLVVNTANWITFTPVKGTEKLRMVIIIPPFSVSVPFWLGAPYITFEFRANFTENFSILTPIHKPSLLPNFFLAIRSVTDFMSKYDYNVNRYIMWARNDGTEEMVSWPIYNGETICKSFALEIWTTNGPSEPNPFTSMTTALYLETSILVAADSCDDLIQDILPITPVCNLFAELPLLINPIIPIIDTPLLDEFNNPILTEDGIGILI